MSHILEVTNLEVEFSGDGGKNISVDHVGFHVDSGEIVCISSRENVLSLQGSRAAAKVSQPCLSWDFWEKGAR